MNEFCNRIEAQRQILRRVNRRTYRKEELFGLSTKAIDRWIEANRLDADSALVQLVTTASSKLFFLANKSQEQISPEYQTTASEIASIADAIEVEIACASAGAFG